jgi:hypothetical protein
VHVLSLGHAKNYVAPNDMGRFTTALCERLTGGRVTDKWKNAVEHYTDLKAKPIQEQLLDFSEEIAITLSGSPAAGMMLGPGLLPLANEFLLRNLGIAADFFGDEQTTREMAAAVRSVHEDHPAKDVRPRRTPSGQADQSSPQFSARGGADGRPVDSIPASGRF